jgi:glyoxylase I family protein
VDQSRPLPLRSIAHIALTVTDIDASVTWYEDVLGLVKLLRLPHDGGYGILMATPDHRTYLVLHHHDGNDGQRFSEVRTGLDHVGFEVEDLAQLERWQAWFEGRGVTHSPITALEDFDGSVLVFRDLDDIQLELYAPH